MNIAITKTEELDFPNFETCLYTNCKARFAEFNRFGTLLAIGCKYGITLIMDFISKEIVRIFDYYGKSDLDFNNDISNFVQFSNGDYSQIYDLFEHEDIQAAKKITKIPSPKSKEHPEAVISSIEWSYDSNYLLISYQQINKIVLWNVETCEKVFDVPIEDKIFEKAQLYPYNSNVAIVSSAHPYIIDMKTREMVKFTVNKKKNEEEKMVTGEFEQRKTESLSEEWLVIALSMDKSHYFLLVNPENYLIFVKERTKAMEDVQYSKKFEKKIADLINSEKFEILDILQLTVNGKITSLVSDSKQNYVLLNASDRCLRLIQIIYGKEPQITLQKEFVDVINRKKWMTTGFYTIGHPKTKEFIVSGVGESGSHDVCFMSLDNDNTEKRIGPSKEGCVNLCGHCLYHNSIVVVTSNGDLLLWSVRNPKCWTALAPDFTEIEENIEYVEKEDEFDMPNTVYVPPVTSPTEVIPVDKAKNYYDVIQEIEAYSIYSKFECLENATKYLPKSSLVVVRTSIKSDFLTDKGKADVKKLKEKMESRGIFVSKKSEGGTIEIFD